MSKKIQLSTVRQTADVEVLYVNANLISKTIKAETALGLLIESLKAQGCIVPRYEPELDENGEPKVDKDGCVIDRKVIDEKTGKQIIDYCSCRLNADDIAVLYETIAPFLKELVDAFDE
jgi:hypothetical protein